MNHEVVHRDLLDPIILPVLPVPEPETHAMMLVGLGMVGFFMARRRVRSAV
jgi:hypothetical protein